MTIEKWKWTWALKLKSAPLLPLHFTPVYFSQDDNWKVKVNLSIEAEKYPSPPNTLFSSLSLVYIRRDEQMKMGKFISQKIKIEKEDLALVTV